MCALISHTPSQFLLKPPAEKAPPSPSLVTCPSYSMPTGLVPKTKPGLLITIGVENDLEAVGLDQLGVAAAVGNDDLSGLAVVTHNPK